MKKIICLVFALLLLSACEFSRLDGDWDEMEWKKTSYQTIKDDYYGFSSMYYHVPAEGGTYVFHCKNYKGIWLNDCEFVQDGESSHSYDDREYYADGITDYNHYENKWCSVAAEGDSLKVVFQPNEEGVRKAMVTVTAGDIFDLFRFRQEGSQKDMKGL